MLLDEKKKIVIALFLFLITIEGYLFISYKKTIKNIADCEKTNIILIYEFFTKIDKNLNLKESILIDNYQYINNDILIEQMQKSTPFYIEKSDKNIDKYSASISYYNNKNADKNYLNTLGSDSYFVQKNSKVLYLFGRVSKEHYILISKSLSDQKNITLSIYKFFMAMAFCIVVLIVFLFYLYIYAKNLIQRKNNLEIEYKELFENTKNLAFVDTLTKASSRLRLESYLIDLIENSRRFGKTFSFIMFDIDKFKSINDTYGHDQGDKVLVRISEVIRSSIRKSDLFARYGGEEFVLILPQVKIEDSKLYCESIRQKIEKIDHHGIDRAITCSFGIVQFKNCDDMSSLIKRADDLLYSAKNSGRNCIRIEDE